MTPKIHHHVPTLKADLIGELDQDGELALFRGIPFASVEKRWTQSCTTHSLNSPFDATQFGPRCSQGNGPVLVSGGVNDPTPGDDEFNCLNLNIAVPKEALPEHESNKAGSKLPVMVWIHGGAFTYGANSVARYRPQLLSLAAKRAGTPIVLVQIGYRLGSFGFAASSDIGSELEDSRIPNGHSKNHQNGDVQSCLLGNYGLIDQRNAFEWVRDHIGDFGGNPSNVTAFGISAGSASIHYHILTGEPLFDRAIMMSGAAPTLGPLPLARYEKAWKELCEKSGVQGNTAAQRLEQLRALDPEALIENYSKAPLGPLADGKLLPALRHLGQPQTPTRCKEIILGDTRVEAIIMDGLSLKIPQERFHQLTHSAFALPHDAESFLTHFGFTTSPTLPYDAYRDAMRLFLSAAMFQFPNLRIAESYASAGNAYLYHFEEPSPYAGPTFGVPYHGQCALFMYLNECETYPETARRTATEMAGIWTAFAHGKRPWEPYSKAQRFMRFGPGGKSSVQDLRSDDVREYGYVNWMREHFEEVKLFAQNLTQQ